MQDIQAVAALSATHEVPIVEYRKDGGLGVSKMRLHRGNIPVLPQTKLCPHCPAKFTRNTHLNRHLRTHTGERLHHCDTCDARFTRSDLLTRHIKTCKNLDRRRDCEACAESKVKCDLEYPCSRCLTREKSCVFSIHSSRRTSSDASPESVVSVLETQNLQRNLSRASPTRAPNHYALPHVIDAVEAQDTGISSVPSQYVSSNVSSNGDLPSESSTSTQSTPISSHLSGFFSNDMLEPFFSNIFSGLHYDFLSTDNVEYEVAQTHCATSSTDDPFGFMTQSLVLQPLEVAHSNTANHYPQLDHSFSDLLNISPMPSTEEQSYLSLFFSTFLEQMPLIHPPTFEVVPKPRVLISAMEACGALYGNTPTAAKFIMTTLRNSREILIQEFAKNSSDIQELENLVLAVMLLQTIGLFHQNMDERVQSNMMHTMLVMMIRRTNLIAHNASWMPSAIPDRQSCDMQWREWAWHETIKRALLLSYLHDTCHRIYSALPASYTQDELNMYLPCEDALWKAQTPEEWFDTLHRPSIYGDFRSRLMGISMPTAIEIINTPRLSLVSLNLNPYSQFILIHSVLLRLFTFCNAQSNGTSEPKITENGPDALMLLQFALHNWLQSWLTGPDLPKKNEGGREPIFMFNALPFYWLGQLAIMAFQEGLPPFERTRKDSRSDATFRLIKNWLRHIRTFLRSNGDVPTLFWDQLMIIRLRSWREEMEGEIPDDQQGLLGFFPSDTDHKE